jgi:hypothetical protein
MKKIFLIIILAGVFLTGCKEDFLELYPTNQIDENAAFSSPQNAMAALYGIYDLITEPRLLASWVPVTNDLRGDDVFIAQVNNWNYLLMAFNYTWLASTASTTRSSPAMNWTLFYAVIENCNGAINADLPFNEEGTATFLGEVKTIRALAYFNLVQMFCVPYTRDNGASPGVPLYEVSDASQLKGRGTVAEVYNLIESDLTDAIAALGVPETIGRIGKVYAQGLMARVKLTKGEYADALTYINAAIAGAPDLSSGEDLALGVNRVMDETIFAVPFNSDDYGIYWGLTSSYDHPEGYGNAFMTTALLNTYPADDMRRKWFITPLFYNYNDPAIEAYFGDFIQTLYHFEGYHSYSFTEIQDIYDAGTPVSESIFWPNDPNSWCFTRPGHVSLYGKFPRLDAVRGSSFGSVGLDQPSLMRTSELYLMKAECEARKSSPDYAAAQDALFALQSRSSASAVKSSSTGATLIDEIMMERRRELVGEGFRITDILRLGLPLNRPQIPGPAWSPIKTLDATAPRLIYPIPEVEIDANDFINNADQNPGYN